MNQLTGEEIRALVHKTITTILDSFETDLVRSADSNRLIAPKTPEARDAAVAALDSASAKLKGQLPFAWDDKELHDMARTTLKNAGIDNEVDPDSLGRLVRELGKARITILDVQRARLMGEEHPYDNKPLPAPKSTAPLLSEAMAKRLAVVKYTLKGRSAQEFETQIPFLLKLLGDKPVDQYVKEDFLKAQAILKRWPRHANTRAKELTFEETLKRTDLGEPFSAVTVNKYATVMSTVMNFCVKEDWIVKSKCPTPPKGRRQQKRPFNDDDLAKLFTSTIYSKSAVRDLKPHNYWIPLIGMLSGMRLNEICQLYLDDIKQIDGIWCFDAREEGDKSIKNESSNRLVPIHHFLIEHGLLEYADALRANKIHRLWPKLKLGPNGYSHSYGHNINRHLKRYVTGEIGVDKVKPPTFHSLRAKFDEAMRRNGAPLDVSAQILGHAPGQRIAVTHYGGKYPVAVLNEVVQQVDFPALRLLTSK